MADWVLRLITVLLFLVVFKHSFEAYVAVFSAKSYIYGRFGKLTFLAMVAGIVFITILEGGLFWLFVKYVIFGG